MLFNVLYLSFYSALNGIKYIALYLLAKNGGWGGGGVPKWAYFCIQPSSNFICPMYSPICLLYRVIQDFVQKAPFPEIQAI